MGKEQRMQREREYRVGGVREGRCETYINLTKEREQASPRHD